MFENHQKMSYCLTPSFNFQKLATLAKLANFDSFNWLLSTQCSQCWMRLFLCFSNIVSIIKSRVLCEFQSETLSVTHPSFKSLDEGRRAQEEGDKTLELMPELPCNDAFFERRSWESGVCSFMFFSLRGLSKKSNKITVFEHHFKKVSLLYWFEFPRQNCIGAI